jgi:hypothetical protein
MSGVAEKARPGLFLRARAFSNMAGNIRIGPHRCRMRKIVDPMAPHSEPFGFKYRNCDRRTNQGRHGVQSSAAAVRKKKTGLVCPVSHGVEWMRLHRNTARLALSGTPSRDTTGCSHINRLSQGASQASLDIRGAERQTLEHEHATDQEC